MKKRTTLVILCITLSLTLLFGCSNGDATSKTTTVDNGNNTSQNADENQGSHTLTVNLNVTNAAEKDDSYFVYFVIPGKKETETGKATQSGVSKAYETDQNGTVVIDISSGAEDGWKIRDMVENKDSTRPKSLELYVTTKEDIYIRNPLNAETIIDFIVLVDEDDGNSYDYLFTQPELNLDITDKYPEGVVSLTFQDAVFVLKLAFEEPTPKSAYQVSLVVASDTASDGMSMVRTGRIDRAFQYWDTPFFADEVTGKRAVLVTDFDTDERIDYEGYPLWLDFNDDGTCKQGDIIVVNMPAGS